MSEIIVPYGQLRWMGTDAKGRAHIGGYFKVKGKHYIKNKHGMIEVDGSTVQQLRTQPAPEKKKA